jgi:hypothetical protein
MYNTVRRVLTDHGYINMPIMDDESGFPWHIDTEPDVNNELAADSNVSDIIGEQLVAGCNFIIIYVGVDDPPGCSWDAYYGLRKYCMPNSYLGIGDLDTKEKQLNFLNNVELKRWGYGLYGPYTDVTAVRASDNSGYVVTGVKDKNGVWQKYSYVDPANPWHPAWYKLKFWSKAGMYNSYRAPGATISGIKSDDQYIISRSDWADQYTVCFKTDRNKPQITITIPTSWSNGTAVTVKQFIDSAADSTETFNTIQDSSITVANKKIQFPVKVARYNQFIFTRTGVNPFPTQVVLSSTKTVINSDGNDTVIIRSELVDVNNRLVVTAENTVTFTVTAPGKLPTVYSLPSVNGVATIPLTVSKTQDETTNVTVTGTSAGVSTGTINITIAR